ncbi:hypothetical protein X942_5822 [Burkholderia pseudomallei MSHR5596]|nr:hypothetical protein X942_5822 [Burkholderia pseudomallei MSHR5596]
MSCSISIEVDHDACHRKQLLPLYRIRACPHELRRRDAAEGHRRYAQPHRNGSAGTDDSPGSISHDVLCDRRREESERLTPDGRLDRRPA